MAQLMNDLQDVARASTGKISLEPRRLDLAQLVWRPLDALRLAGRFRQHALTIVLAPAWTDADPTRMEQVVVNLLTNAVKYTPAEGTIELSVQRDGEDAVLQVRDSGLGIAPHVLPHVFDLFVQADRTAGRRHAGMGIGLTLVRRLTELHGGSVRAHSAGPDRGSTFVVRLPAVAEESMPPRPWRGRHAVIVAAEQLPLETAMRLVEAGCRVTLLAEAVAERIAALRPHVVLVDPARPGAAELAQALVASGSQPLCVALVDSGVLPRGFDIAMAPPVDPARLDECMRAASRPVASP
jgi:anti-sigma regulatory factor (Ser/Thr protein kinase)